VAPFKEDSIFWDGAWKAHGCPREGPIFEWIRNAKLQYHYAVRRLKRRESQLRTDKFAQAIADDNTRNLFKEVKKQSPRPRPVNCMNGVEGADGIANVFHDKYEILYNRLPADAQKITEVKDEIVSAMAARDWAFEEVTIDMVRRSIALLKASRKDGESSFNSCHLIHASDRFLHHLTALINAMLTHGHLAPVLLRATIISIPKDYSKSLQDDNNYRGTALCSSISKLLDIIMLLRNRNAMKTCDTQYAFKKGHGTSTCTYVLKELVHSYTNRASNVYACFLDASKAFDLVRYDVLFPTLLKRGVNPIDIRLLLHQYENQKCRTTFQGRHSNYFDIRNGVRQGGVASPTLFCMYLDVLLEQLEDVGAGCHWNGDFFGCLAYADDLVLLSPSICGLKTMLRICEEFSVQTSLCFNPAKSVCVCFRKRKRMVVPQVTLSGHVLPWADEAKHLGVWLQYNLSEKKEIMCSRSDLAGRTNLLLSNMRNADLQAKLKIFEAQCAHMYGATTWNFMDEHVKLFKTMHNRCVRRVLGVPNRTHTALLPLLCKRPPVSVQLASRLMKFIKVLEGMESRTGRLARSALLDNSSILSCNLSIAVDTVNCDPPSDENIATALAVEELLYEPPPEWDEEARTLAFFLCVM
jgi:flagellar biosynthesis regulator FlaF